jgi:hypothetical protein
VRQSRTRPETSTIFIQRKILTKKNNEYVRPSRKYSLMLLCIASSIVAIGGRFVNSDLDKSFISHVSVE